jgi:hypothetical protein
MSGSNERYEVLAITPDRIADISAPVANRDTDRPIIGEINSAKNTEDLRIVSRRAVAASALPGFDPWY